MHDTETDTDRSRGRESREAPADHSASRRYRVGPDEPLDVAITYAIATMERVDPTEVEPPLHDVVDPEALERLFESATGDARARFTVGTYDVTVVDGGQEVLVSGD